MDEVPDLGEEKRVTAAMLPPWIHLSAVARRSLKQDNLGIIAPRRKIDEFHELF